MKNSGAWYAIIAALFTYMLFKPSAEKMPTEDYASQSSSFFKTSAPAFSLPSSSAAPIVSATVQGSESEIARTQKTSNLDSSQAGSVNDVSKKSATVHAHLESVPSDKKVTKPSALTKEVNLDGVYDGQVGIVLPDNTTLRVNKEDKKNLLSLVDHSITNKNDVVEAGEKMSSLAPSENKISSLKNKVSAIKSFLNTTGAMASCNMASEKAVSRAEAKKSIENHVCLDIEAKFNEEFKTESSAIACKDKMFFERKLASLEIIKDIEECVDCASKDDCDANILKLSYRCKKAKSHLHRSKYKESDYNLNKKSLTGVCSALAVNIVEDTSTLEERVLASPNLRESIKTVALSKAEDLWSDDSIRSSEIENNMVLADNLPSNKGQKKTKARRAYKLH